MNDTKKNGALGDLNVASGLDISVVLVQPSDPRNIGAVARAMSNMAVSDLRLVDAAKFDAELAKGVACWGRDLIDSARSFPRLEEAVADCHEVVGFASDSGRHRVSQLVLKDWVTSLAEGGEKRIGLVFGSEENGLLREHFPLCQHLIRIPSSGENPSYNLAQSVLLALFAIRTNTTRYVGMEQPEWPTSAQFGTFTDMVLKVAEHVGFLNDNSPAHIQELLVNITRRGRLSVRELKILTGLFGMIERRVR